VNREAPAPVLHQLVEGAITQHIGLHAVRLTTAREQPERDLLTRMRQMTEGAA
jgi:hypothetical protein